MSTKTKSEAVVRVVTLETSGRLGSLAAVRAERADKNSPVEIVAERKLPGDLRTAQSLLPALAQLIDSCGWQMDELDLVCTTTGPGSFTGLRIGVTTAKTLAYATGAKLVGVHTLAAIAAAVDAPADRIWAVLDAQRQELFAAGFQPGWQNSRKGVPETLVIGIDDWIGQLRKGDLVTGPPLEKLSRQLPPSVTPTDASLWSPSAVVVAKLGLVALERGEAIDPMQLVPNYYRKSAAEEKAEAKR